MHDGMNVSGREKPGRNSIEASSTSCARANASRSGYSERLSLRGIDKEAGRSFSVHQLVVFRGSRSEEIRLHQQLKDDVREDGWYGATPALCAAMLRAAGPPDSPDEEAD